MRDEHDVDEAPWMEFAGMVESGDPHSSLSIDTVVYDWQNGNVQTSTGD